MREHREIMVSSQPQRRYHFLPHFRNKATEERLSAEESMLTQDLWCCRRLF